MMPVMIDSQKALLRSQSGPFSGAILSATFKFSLAHCPWFVPGPLLHRLRLPLPPTARTCRCGRLLDSLLARGFAVENAVARCREGGARVSTNIMVRDLDVLAPQALDS